jgi:uncharacterized protein (UPF0276 family)
MHCFISPSGSDFCLKNYMLFRWNLENGKPLLAAGYSPALQSLIDKSRLLPLQALEFGLYNKLSSIERQLTLFGKFQLFFHPGSAVRNLKESKRLQSVIRRYHQLTKTPWLSFHIDLKSPLRIFLASRHLYRKPLPVNFKRTNQFIQNINNLKLLFDQPFLLEVMPSSNFGDIIESDPQMVTSIINTTNCDLLLDIAHIRINAFHSGESFESYLDKLPLLRTREIHISGIRHYLGQFYDAHETIEMADLDCLELVLSKTNAQVVTLEYHKDCDLIERQLNQIKELIG